MIKIKSYGSGSKGNLYLVSNSNTNIILECGLGIETIKTMLNENKLQFKNINACLSSHVHQDHSQSIAYLYDYNIPCYATNETRIRYNLSYENFTPLNDNTLYKINDIQIISIQVNHGKTDCFGFIFKDKDNMILFITDFMECKKNLKKFKFNEIFIECNYIEDLWETNRYNEDNDLELENKYKRQLNTHQNLNNLITHLQNMDLSKCDKITLIHISEDIGNRDIMKNTIEEEFGIECVALLSNGVEY